jgi:phage recombination protein Bet
MRRPIMAETAKKINYLPVSYKVDGDPVRLTFQDIKDLICRGQTHTPSDQEVVAFMQFCKYMKANPFVNDAYLIKYDKNKPASFVVGVGFYLKTAEKNPNYKGYLAGVIVQNKEGVVEDLQGAFIRPNDTLLGGWCQAYRDDRECLPVVKINLERYQRMRWDDKLKKHVPMALWKTNDADMILKVAVSQAHRNAFKELRGSVTDAEVVSTGPVEAIQIEEETPEVEPDEKAMRKLAMDKLRHMGLKFDEQQLEAYAKALGQAMEKPIAAVYELIHDEVDNKEAAAKFQGKFEKWLKAHGEEPAGGKQKKPEGEATPSEGSGPEAPPEPGEPDLEEQFAIRLEEADLVDAWGGYKIAAGIDTPEKEADFISKAMEQGLDACIKTLGNWWIDRPPKEQKAILAGKAPKEQPALF